MELIVDTRESKVVPFFEDSYLNVTITIKQIQVGDYAICCDGNILFIIERKTWHDLAASIKDGRKENVNKLFLAREETGCKIIYLIEGKPRHSLTKKFGHIAFKNLQAHLDHLIIRDNIHVIYSSSCEDTAARLIEFINNYLSLNILIEPKGGNNSHKNTFDLTKKIPKNDLQIIYNIWCCIPNVTEKTANIFLQEGWHISDLILGKIAKTDIYAMKYANGTIIGKRASKIYKITENNINNSTVFQNMLSCINGITKKTASIIVTEFDFFELISGKFTIENIAKVQKTEKTKIGTKAASEIIKFFIKAEEN